jgi:hypothetical protein
MARAKAGRASSCTGIVHAMGLAATMIASPLLSAPAVSEERELWTLEEEKDVITDELNQFVTSYPAGAEGDRRSPRLQFSCHEPKEGFSGLYVRLLPGQPLSSAYPDGDARFTFVTMRFGKDDIRQYVWAADENWMQAFPPSALGGGVASLGNQIFGVINPEYQNLRSVWVAEEILDGFLMSDVVALRYLTRMDGARSMVFRTEDLFRKIRSFRQHCLPDSVVSVFGQTPSRDALAAPRPPAATPDQGEFLHRRFWSGWRNATDEVRGAALAAVAWPERPVRFADVIVQVKATSFYRDVDLVGVSYPVNDTGGRAAQFFLRADSGELVKLDKTSRPIHLINARAMNLTDRRAAEDYLFFFTYFVFAEAGHFYIAEDAADPELAMLSDAERDRMRTFLRPASCAEDRLAGMFLCDTNVYHSNAVFAARFRVVQNGTVEMVEDKPIMGDLSRPKTSFIQ